LVTNMTHLDRSTLPAGHLIGTSAPETTGIVHFGLGSFHRAHAAVYTALAMAAEPGEWGIVGVANRSHPFPMGPLSRSSECSNSLLAGEDIGSMLSAGAARSIRECRGSM
jgi:Mannitol dehydrogenase Rossmann domain